MRVIRLLTVAALYACSALTGIACDAPNTTVVIDNKFSSSTTEALFIDRAFWQAVSFTTPIPPGSSSDPQSTVAASANTAYVLVAPGLARSADGGPAPAHFIVLQSIDGFEVHLNQVLHIPVDDHTFSGNCTAGRFLTQDQADFITQRVFQDLFAGLHYDAATCSASSGP